MQTAWMLLYVGIGEANGLAYSFIGRPVPTSTTR
jgi:hypothetical protein